jgi:hypothetical protein
MAGERHAMFESAFSGWTSNSVLDCYTVKTKTLLLPAYRRRLSSDDLNLPAKKCYGFGCSHQRQDCVYLVTLSVAGVKHWSLLRESAPVGDRQSGWQLALHNSSTVLTTSSYFSCLHTGHCVVSGHVVCYVSVLERFKLVIQDP